MRNEAKRGEGHNSPKGKISGAGDAKADGQLQHQISTALQSRPGPMVFGKNRRLAALYEAAVHNGNGVL